MTKTRAEVAREFLLSILGPLPADSCVEVRLKRNDEKGSRQQFFTALADINVEKFGFDEHVWFGVSLRKRGTNTGKAADLTWATCVWADFDHVENKDEVVRRLRQFEHPPSVIVDSGGGLHAYWRLGRPLDLQNDQQATFVREVVHGLAHKLGADPNVHDLPRVLRIPGTFNAGNGKTKTYNPPREAAVLLSDPRVVYAVEDLSKHRRPLAQRSVAQQASQLVILPTTVTPVPVPQLKVPERLRKLVRDGWSRGCGYPSRSELDHAVMVAMIRGDHTTEEIAAVFQDPANKISEKFFEKGADGPRYLAATLAAAQDWVRSTGPGSLDIREQGGALEARREKEWVQVFNRPMKAVAKLTGEETGYRVEITTPAGPEYRIFRAGDMASNVSFKKALGMAGAWMGDDRDVQRLLIYLEAQNPPVKKAVRVVGWDGEQVVFPNAILAQDDTLSKDNDYLYLGKLVDARLDDHDDWNTVAREILTTLPTLNTSSGLTPVIGWFMATFAAPRLRRLTPDNAFPLLMLFGSPEGGKSTTFEIMQTLCGRHASLFALKETTPFTAMELLSSSNTLPVVFDEHRRTDKSFRRSDLYPTFRMAYQAGIGTRGRQDMSVLMYHLTAPIAIAGETPFRDPALVDRTVHVKFDRNAKNEAALKKLAQLPLTQFNAGFYRHVRSKDLRALYAEAERLLPTGLRDSMQLRQRHAWTVVAAGLLLLEPFWSRAEIEAAIGKLQDYRLDTSEEVTVSTKGMVYETVRVLAELVRARRIREGADYVIREYNGEHILFIIPAIVLPAIEEYFTRFPSDMPTAREAILQRLREESRTVDPIIVKYQDSFKLGGRSTRGIGVLLENVEKEMSIPVEYWLAGAIVGSDSL